MRAIPNLLFTSAVVLSVVGCGSGVKTVPVEGRVTYNGEPLQFGSVMFQSPSGQPARAMIQPNGTFRLETTGVGDGAVVGRNMVRVTCFEGQNPNASGSSDGEVALGESLIPLRYTAYETSGLVFEVSPDHREPIHLELTD